MVMVFAVEAWTDDDDSQLLELDDVRECDTEQEARAFAWQKLEEGFAVKLWRRASTPSCHEVMTGNKEPGVTAQAEGIISLAYRAAAVIARAEGRAPA